ncbi:PepSY-associated TM helix domain-containing protein [Rapidithrix thailandica]|uniref:PepSY-associated TM helix domain-containing protein n=1 Tax=Rapidithrix thailandica TaxID=413964 RepID=A0AAW9S7W1_9BACT
MKKKYSLRKFFNDIHLWLGIASGIVLFIVCLSGTLYTFHAEVEEMLEPEKYRVEAPKNTAPMLAEALLSKVQEETGGTASAISIPRDPHRPYRITIKKSPKDRRGTAYYVDPYTAEIKGTSKGPASEFFMTMFRLHRWLLMEQNTGRIIVGISTIIFAVLLITGMVLWFPKRLKNIKQGLKVKTNGNWKRLNHDLHNTLGFYTFPLLLVMCLTGLCWSFGWYRDGLSSVMGAKVFGGRGAKPTQIEQVVPDTPARSVAQLIQLTDEHLPYTGDYNIYLPSDPQSAAVVYKYQTGFFALSAYDKAEFNPYNGHLLKLDKFSDKALNEKIVATIKPLHTGEIFGTFSKILYFISCLIATSLPVTGTIIWINKLKKKAAKKKKAVVS